MKRSPRDLIQVLAVQIRAVAASGALTLLGACGGGDAGTPTQPDDLPPTIASIVLAPSKAQIFDGDSVRFVATAYSGPGAPMQVTFTWASSDPTVASVDTTGMTTGHRVGVTPIFASVGKFSGAASLTVVERPNEVPVVVITEPDDESSFGRGRSVTFAGGAVDPEDGQVPDSSLAWWAGNSLLGTGPELTTPDLNAGVRFVRLVATDSGGAEGVDSVQVTIQEPVGTDTTPPVLVALALSKDTLIIGSQPDTVAVTMRITEDVTGIDLVAAIFLSTTTSQVVGWTPLHRTEGDYYDGTFVGQLVFPQNAAVGTWDLWVSAMDQVGNLMSLRWTELADFGLPSGVVVR